MSRGERAGDGIPPRPAGARPLPLPRPDGRAAQFRFVTGLAGGGTVSIQSVNFPDRYWRVSGTSLRIEPIASGAVDAAQASFCRVPGLANSSGILLELSDQPGLYVRHDKERLTVGKPAGAKSTFWLSGPLLAARPRRRLWTGGADSPPLLRGWAIWFSNCACRWMAYFGDPILAADLLFRPGHSLIDESLNSRLGASTANSTASAWAGTAVGRNQWCTSPSSQHAVSPTSARTPATFGPRCSSRTCAHPRARRYNARTAIRDPRPNIAAAADLAPADVRQMGRFGHAKPTSPRGLGTQAGRDWHWLSCLWSRNGWTRSRRLWRVLMSPRSPNGWGCSGPRFTGGGSVPDRAAGRVGGPSHKPASCPPAGLSAVISGSPPTSQT